MLTALLSMFIISVIMILTSASLGIWKVFELVTMPWFIVICVVYFGIILSTTGLLTYVVIRIVKDAKNTIEAIKVELNKILKNLKDKLSSVPKFVWDVIKKIFK